MAAGHEIDPSLQGAVSEHAFMVVLWIFWFLALIALVVRITVYVRARRRPQVDDYLLMISVACLTVATLWMQTRYRDAYQTIALSIDPFKAGIPTNLSQVIYKAQLVNYVYGPLIWTAIFAAKWSYLWFFRQLIHHIKPLKTYWWFVFIFTCVVYPVCLAGVYISCPHMDIMAFKCNENPLIQRAYIISIVSVVLDILTDIMIVSIPIWLLWKVQIRPTQKLGLACFLCLSVVIAVMAIIRVSPLRINNETSNLAVYSVWVDMMGQVEACVAVCLVSLTAFRYFFVMHERRRRQERGHDRRSWYRPRINTALNRPTSDSEERGMAALPTIPSATLTGLQTFIRNVRGSTTVTATNSMVFAPETGHSDEVPFFNEKGDEESIPSQSTCVSDKTPASTVVETHTIDSFAWDKR